MAALVLRVVCEKLTNPDLDVRYVLPDLLTERSGGVIKDDGYDYDKNGDLLLYLETSNLDLARECVSAVIQNEQVLGNDLTSAVIAAWKEHDQYRVFYPSGFTGSFAEGIEQR